MKNIDAEKLKAEIERHIKEVKEAENRFHPNLGFFDAKLSGIYETLSILDSLQQEQSSLPGNIDEAAKEYDEAESWRYEALPYPRRAAFKAGAEWMARQMKQGQPPMGYDEAYINECIAKASKTWKGVDVDKFIDEMRGRETVDLEEDVKKYFGGLWPGIETSEQCNTDMRFTPPAIMRLAEYFYELGLNARKEE